MHLGRDLCLSDRLGCLDFLLRNVMFLGRLDYSLNIRSSFSLSWFLNRLSFNFLTCLRRAIQLLLDLIHDIVASTFNLNLDAS